MKPEVTPTAQIEDVVVQPWLRSRSVARPGGGIPHVSNECPLPAFAVTRGGVALMLRPHRYAVAGALGDHCRIR